MGWTVYYEAHAERALGQPDADQYSTDARADFFTVVRAIQALAAARPDLRFTISDDFYILDAVEPSAVGDPEAFMARLDGELAEDPMGALDRMFGRS